VPFNLKQGGLSPLFTGELSLHFSKPTANEANGCESFDSLIFL